jgi:probable HAF family extracellular repeat protein
VGESLIPNDGIVQHAFSWQFSSTSDLGTLGGQNSGALAVNNDGAIGGWSQDASGNSTAAIWVGGTATSLPNLGGVSGTAWGLNDQGAAVGISSLNNGVTHAALWSGGGVQDLGTLGGNSSIAYEISNTGMVVGRSLNASGKERACLWNSDGPVDLGGLSSGQWTTARDVNDAGQMVFWGTPEGASQNRAAFWDGKSSSSVIDIGTFGGTESWAYGLNSQGFVVGSANLQNGTYHAFVWNGSEKTDLGTLGGLYSLAYDINDNGIIVGLAMDENNVTHAVEWILVPEPSVLVLGLAGGSIVGLWARWRRLSSLNRNSKSQPGTASSSVEFI